MQISPGYSNTPLTGMDFAESVASHTCLARKTLSSCPRVSLLAGSELWTIIPLVQNSNWHIPDQFKEVYSVSHSSNLHPGSYILVDRGASCEASGYTRMSSVSDCHKALQNLGLSHDPKGTVNQPSPQGCYLRFDGHLWYNTNEQSTDCNPQSKCVCWIGEYLLCSC